MSQTGQLEDLLLLWQQRRQEGRDASVEELCADCPELASQLRERITALASMEAFMGVEAEDREAVTVTAPVAATTEVKSGSFPGYEIVDELGRGGMGVVYRAIQKATKRTVALKVMLQGQHASAKQRLRFEREIDLVAALRHPNIVTVYDSGVTAEGLQYFAMEYIPGISLEEHLKSGKLNALHDVLSLFVKICRAVNYAHQRGIIHRDLKPGNIRIDAEGEPHVLDFGLAKLAGEELDEQGKPITVTGEFLGTLAYASPEQAGGDLGAIDIRTDVYSLGIILYQMLTRQLPHAMAGRLADMLRAILEVEPPAPSSRLAQAPDKPGYRIDEYLDAIVLKALAKERERRYQSAGALADDVTHYLSGEPIQARPPSLAFLLRTWFKQNFRAAIRTIIVGIVCGGLSSFVVGLPRLLPNLFSCAETYARFPSLSRPWLAVHLLLPDWLMHVLSLFGALAFVGMGLFTVLLVRPRTRWDDMIAGLATGLTGGVTAFIISGGWGSVMATTVMISAGDLHLLSHLNGQDDVTEALLARYPDLRDASPAERSSLLRDKIMGDLIVGIPRGIWLGMLFTMVSIGIFGVLGTMVAGALLRRDERMLMAILPYLEATIPSAWLILLGYLQVFYPLDGSGWRWLVVLLFGLLSVGAVVGVLKDWPARLRFALYLAGTQTGITCFRIAHGQPNWLADTAVFLIAAGFVLGHFVGLRRGAAQR